MLLQRGGKEIWVILMIIVTHCWRGGYLIFRSRERVAEHWHSSQAFIGLAECELGYPFESSFHVGNSRMGMLENADEKGPVQTRLLGRLHRYLKWAMDVFEDASLAAKVLLDLS